MNRRRKHSDENLGVRPMLLGSQLMPVTRERARVSLDRIGLVEIRLDGILISPLTCHTSGASHWTSECFLPCGVETLSAPPDITVANAGCNNVCESAVETITVYIHDLLHLLMFQ